MLKANTNYLMLEENYLFSNIARKIKEYTSRNPDSKLIKMGIGDVTQPLPKTVVKNLVAASLEMGAKESFRGYGPEQGYDFLREKIVSYYKNEMNVSLEIDEVFISDGAKSDIANITDLFANSNTVCVPDPVYPVYADTNTMLGRKIVFMQGDENNGFLPMPNNLLQGDIFYLCSPNNPTGATYNYEQLQQWVDFALKRGAIILFDAAYERFVTEKLPRSIYEIDGAKKCAIEFCSLSKTAGFTGTRCGYTVVPFELKKDNFSFNKMWLRRQTTKFNGVSYIVQRGAEAVFSESGLSEINSIINVYKRNAGIISETMQECGLYFTGGLNSPYIWVKCPYNMTSWSFFDFLLEKIEVVGTPGSGFGACGEGYLRLSAFNTEENVLEAMQRFRSIIK